MTYKKLSDDGKIPCMLCEKRYHLIVGGHLKTHGYTKSRYQEEFPDAPMISDALSAKLSKRMLELGEDHWMKRPEHRIRQGKRWSKLMSGENNPSKRLEVRAKLRKATLALGENHPQKRPEARVRNSKRVLALGEKHWSKRPKVREKIREARQHQVFPTEDTNIEKMIYAELTRRRIKFDAHFPVRGQPDVRIKKLLVFCDGCYWHGCPVHCPDNGKGLRDAAITLELEQMGYTVVRFWEHDILSDVSACADKIIALSQ